MLGPPGIGKSFALLLLTQLLIAGTWCSYTYVTAKGLGAPGKANACLVMIFEDAPSTTLGVSGGSGGGAKKNASSDQENMMKQFLTSMELVIGSVTMDPKRAAEKVKCETGCIVFAAMNDSSHLFPKPVLDRFMVSVSAEEASSGVLDDGSRGVSMMSKTQRAKDDAVRDAMSKLKISWARRQMLVAHIFHMESCGLLHKINLTTADTFYAMVAEIAKKRHIDMERSRPLERYRMMVRVMVVLNAIDLLWDSPHSPLADVPFSMDHFLMVDKYLVASVQMGVFAMGLMSRQWQDNAKAAIVSTMKKCWYPEANRRAKAYQKLKPLNFDGTDPLLDEIGMEAPQPPENYSIFKGAGAGNRPGQRGGAQPMSSEARVYETDKAVYDGMRDEKKHWMYDTVAMGSPLLNMMPQTGAKNPSIDEVVAHLTSKLIPHLPCKFLPLEVAGKIKTMLTETVIVTRKKMTEHGLVEVHAQECAQLVIDGSCIRMAFPTLIAADEGADALFKCVEEAVTIIYVMSQPLPGDKPCQPYEGHAKFMYGQTEPKKGARFVWRMVYADKAKAAKLMADPVARNDACRIYNPSYAEDAVQVVTQNFMKSMDPDWYSTRPMMRFFAAGTPFTVYNCNLDSLAANERADQLGLSYDDQHKILPSNDCTRSDPAIAAHFQRLAESRDTTLLTYPDCFKGRDQVAVKAIWDARHKTHPREFSSQAQMDRLRERQRRRPSIYTMPSKEPPPDENVEDMDMDVDPDFSPPLERQAAFVDYAPMSPSTRERIRAFEAEEEEDERDAAEDV